MTNFGKSLLLALGFSLAALPAAADIPPPDSCKTEGASCDNGGPDADQDGTCEKRMCSRGSATGEITMYECLQCIPGEGKSSKKDDDDGCSMGPVRTEHGIAGVLMLAGLAALRLGRRR